jgi:hypothetical protein
MFIYVGIIMNLIEFPEQNTLVAKDQPQYLPIPAHRLTIEKPFMGYLASEQC